MPRSKRDKKISLTKTPKKRSEIKEKIAKKINSLIDEYKYIYVFNTNQKRNGMISSIRMQFKDSSILFGKNTIMARTLGTSESNEIQENLHKLASKIKGQCGLLFTNRKKGDIIQFFNTYEQPEFAIAGFVPSETITIPEGPLPPEFGYSMEPLLRKLGMPTLLQKGIIMVLSDYKLCKEGKPITPEQSRLLKLFGHKLDTFKIQLDYIWSKEDGTIEKLHG